MNKERLLQLAEHLDTGDLGHEEFNFNTFNSTDGMLAIEQVGKCGTNGCALGECPILWPEDWVFGAMGYPETGAESAHGNSNHVIRAAEIWFGISGNSVRRLFMPKSDFGEVPMVSGQLRADADRHAVAKHIREFVESEEKRN